MACSDADIRSEAPQEAPKFVEFSETCSPPSHLDDVHQWWCHDSRLHPYGRPRGVEPPPPTTPSSNVFYTSKTDSAAVQCRARSWRATGAFSATSSEG